MVNALPPPRPLPQQRAIHQAPDLSGVLSVRSDEPRQRPLRLQGGVPSYAAATGELHIFLTTAVTYSDLDPLDFARSHL
jgi:hypothetical protein